MYLVVTDRDCDQGVLESFERISVVLSEQAPPSNVENNSTKTVFSPNPDEHDGDDDNDDDDVHVPEKQDEGDGVKTEDDNTVEEYKAPKLAIHGATLVSPGSHVHVVDFGQHELGQSVESLEWEVTFEKDVKDNPKELHFKILPFEKKEYSWITLSTKVGVLKKTNDGFQVVRIGVRSLKKIGVHVAYILVENLGPTHPFDMRMLRVCIEVIAGQNSLPLSLQASSPSLSRKGGKSVQNSIFRIRYYGKGNESLGKRAKTMHIGTMVEGMPSCIGSIIVENTCDVSLDFLLSQTSSPSTAAKLCFSLSATAYDSSMRHIRVLPGSACILFVIIRPLKNSPRKIKLEARVACRLVKDSCECITFTTLVRKPRFLVLSALTDEPPALNGIKPHSVYKVINLTESNLQMSAVHTAGISSGIRWDEENTGKNTTNNEHEGLGYVFDTCTAVPPGKTAKLTVNRPPGKAAKGSITICDLNYPEEQVAICTLKYYGTKFSNLEQGVVDYLSELHTMCSMLSEPANPHTSFITSESSSANPDGKSDRSGMQQMKRKDLFFSKLSENDGGNDLLVKLYTKCLFAYSTLACELVDCVSNPSYAGSSVVSLAQLLFVRTLKKDMFVQSPKLIPAWLAPLTRFLSFAFDEPNSYVLQKLHEKMVRKTRKQSTRRVRGSKK